MKVFTTDELAEYNGKNGNPIYIAHDGKIYDVTESKLWRNGLHMKRHQGGHDQTNDLQAAPHDKDVLERYPQVGILKKVVVEQQIPRPIDWLITRYPFLRRHPHPMTVHFPIVFMLFTAVFNLLYLITGDRSFEITALHCLGAGIIFIFVAITTGIYTWWLNYLAKMLQPVKIKMPLSLIMLATAIIIFVWRIAKPDVLVNFTGLSSIYLLLVLSLALMVTVLGWYGASMTFPVEKE